MIAVSDVDDLERRLRRLNAAITDAEASVAALDTRIDTLEAVTGRVAGYFSDSSIAVGTTDTVIVTGDIVIPAGWNTYDITVLWGTRMVDSSGGNTGISTTVTVSVELDSTTIASTQSLEVGDTNIMDVIAAAGPAYAEAETATGTRTVDLIAVRAGAPTLNAFGNRLVVEAWRTS